MKKILIVAGDPSGDLIASQLVESLKKLNPDVRIIGIGGDNLKKVSDHFLWDIVKKHALGFAISPKTIFYFRRILKTVIEPLLKNEKLDAVIPVDFYGFNSRVAALAKKYGHKVFYYVSPQFWASRPWRADRLRNVIDLFLCLFPFEISFYKKKNLPARFVGHPLLDSLPKLSASEPLQQRVECNVGLLPGSRPEEIKRHLPVMIEACNEISNSVPGTRFVLFTVPHVNKQLYLDLISPRKKSNCLIELVEDENYQWRSQLDLALTASGLETLENALLGIPMVVMYKTNWITYVIARLIIRIHYLGMPNLLSDDQIVPEFIQWKATSRAIAGPIINWIKNPKERENIRKKLLNLRNKFGEDGASLRAARAILEKVA